MNSKIIPFPQKTKEKERDLLTLARKKSIKQNGYDIYKVLTGDETETLKYEKRKAQDYIDEKKPF